MIVIIEIMVLRVMIVSIAIVIIAPSSRVLRVERAVEG